MHFVELTLDGIEEGRLLIDANAELLKVQEALLKHVRRYGAAETAGASAKLTMTVELKSVKDSDDAFTITTKLASKIPGRPDTTTLAIKSDSQTGGETLFMRPSGTTADDPAQGRLATGDGRTIDPVTGEPEQPQPDDDTGVAE